MVCVVTVIIFIFVMVVILTLDFEYVNTIQLDDRPYRVQISNTTIGVSCHNMTLFNDLVTKALKYKHKTDTLSINYIDSIFCALNCDEKKMYFFDSDGNFLEENAFH